MLSVQKACSALSKTSLTRCLRRHLFVEASAVTRSKDIGSGDVGMEPPAPQQRPIIDETLDRKEDTLDRRDEAHDTPWRDGISGITHLYDMEEAKSLQQ